MDGGAQPVEFMRQSPFVRLAGDARPPSCDSSGLPGQHSGGRRAEAFQRGQQLPAFVGFDDADHSTPAASRVFDAAEGVGRSPLAHSGPRIAPHEKGRFFERGRSGSPRKQASAFRPGTGAVHSRARTFQRRAGAARPEAAPSRRRVSPIRPPVGPIRPRAGAPRGRPRRLRSPRCASGNEGSDRQQILTQIHFHAHRKCHGVQEVRPSPTVAPVAQKPNGVAVVVDERAVLDVPGRAEEKSLGRGAGSDVRERLAQQRVQPAASVGSAHGDDVEPHNRESAPFFQRAPLPRGVAVVGGHVCVDARNAVVCSAGRGVPAVHDAFV